MLKECVVERRSLGEGAETVAEEPLRVGFDGHLTLT